MRQCSPVNSTNGSAWGQRSAEKGANPPSSAPAVVSSAPAGRPGSFLPAARLVSGCPEQAPWHQTCWPALQWVQQGPWAGCGRGAGPAAAAVATGPPQLCRHATPPGAPGPTQDRPLCPAAELHEDKGSRHCTYVKAWHQRLGKHQAVLHDH